MGGRCPNCDSLAIGEYAARLSLRGTGTPVDAVLCGECGTVYVTDDEIEEMQERMLEGIEDLEDQTRLDTFK